VDDLVLSQDNAQKTPELSARLFVRQVYQRNHQEPFASEMPKKRTQVNGSQQDCTTRYLLKRNLASVVNFI